MRRPPSQTPARATGFTLVELLLAITLMSILLGLTYSGLRAATRSSERGEELLAAGGEIRAAHQFIRRQLNQMLPLSFASADDNEQTRIVFEGDAKHIKYVAPMPGYLGAGGPQVQSLEVVNGDDGDLLIQFFHALVQDFEEDRLYEREPVILIQGVSSADFEFLGTDEDGELTGWSAGWDQPDIIPAAVRLNLEFDPESGLRWPDLVAAVRVDGHSAGRQSYEQSIREMIKRKDQGGS